MPKDNKTLSYKKCRACRKDRQKCLPEGRPWPGARCTRCEKYGYACSASLTKDQEDAICTKSHDAPRLSTPLRQSSNSIDDTLPRGDELIEGKSTKDYITEFSDFTLLYDCASHLASSTVRQFDPDSYEIEVFKSKVHEIQDHLCDLVKILHAKAQRCRIAARVDEAATIDRCLYQQVSLSSFASYALQGKCGTAGYFPSSFGPMVPLTDVAERLCDHYDVVGDHTSALNISRDLYLRITDSRGDRFNSLRTQLTDRYKNFKSRVLAYYPSLKSAFWKPLADLSTLFHFAKGLQHLGADKNFIVPEDWHPSFIEHTHGDYTSKFFRNLNICLAIDFDLPNLLSALSQDSPLAHWNLCDGLDCTPLHLASQLGRYKTAYYLIDRGADVNATTTHDKETPLHSACYLGQVELVALLVCKGANVNQTNDSLRTPLHVLFAEYPRNERKPLYDTIGRYLLGVGARPELVDDDGRNALHLATRYGSLHAVRMLTRLPSQMALLDVKDDKGFTPLHYAINHGRTQVAIFLIKQGHTVNIRNNAGRTPLHFACDMRCATDARAVVECLIRCGTNINQTDKNLDTPMHDAARRGNIEVVKALLENGASPNMFNSNGQTPYALAVLNGENAVSDALCIFEFWASDKEGYS